jgi:hypothetical protein
MSSSMVRFGATARAACTASMASTGNSTGASVIGRSRSSRASSSRSSTSSPIRAASSSIRRISLATSSGSATAPCRNSSANPRIVVSGVRNSCEASATNWRIFSSERTARASETCAASAASRAVDSAERAAVSDSARAVKAASIWVSIVFSARDNRPSSVCGSSASGSGSGTRRVRSPAAMAPAVCSICTSGRRLVRTIAAPTAASAISTPMPTRASIQISWLTAASISDMLRPT